MSMSMSTGARVGCGLVVGKFCPLHLGHELLIRHAMAGCDELIVLSYTKPGFAGYDRARRAAWLQLRFPQVLAYVIDDAWLVAQCRARGVAVPGPMPVDDAPDAVHRHFVAWLLREVLGRSVDAVYTSEAYGDGLAGVLTAQLGRPVAHVCVDLHRRAVPVSGTQIRRDPLACRDLMAPEVWADFVPRVALLGGESTGKTTLARALADALGTCWVPEYGRELWERQGGQLAFDDLEHIALTQVQHELAHAQTARGVLICDTTPLTTLLYSEAMFGRATPALRQLARRPYALTLLCAPDFAFVQDGTRRDERFRADQQAWYHRTLRDTGVDFSAVAGSLAQRVQQVCQLLNSC
jgi:NadR type nicotinamide-nucleotide adenylyltransferase